MKTSFISLKKCVLRVTSFLVFEHYKSDFTLCCVMFALGIISQRDTPFRAKIIKISKDYHSRCHERMHVINGSQKHQIHTNSHYV